LHAVASFSVRRRVTGAVTSFPAVGFLLMGYSMPRIATI